jgi:hypothetical protein
MRENDLKINEDSPNDFEFLKKNIYSKGRFSGLSKLLSDGPKVKTSTIVTTHPVNKGQDAEEKRGTMKQAKSYAKLFKSSKSDSKK